MAEFASRKTVSGVFHCPCRDKSPHDDEHGGFQSQSVWRRACAGTQRAAGRVCGGPPRATGTRHTRSFRTKTTPIPPGSMPICTGSRAISAMPAIGTGGPANRLRPVRSKPNGSGWCRRCSRRRKSMSAANQQTDQGRHRRLGNGDRAGSPCPGHLELKAVFRRLDRIRRRAEQPCLAGRCGDAGHAAGHQRGMRQAGGAHRARPERADQSALGVRPQELFLSGSAAGLSDQPVQVADRGRGRGGGRAGGRRERHHRHRAAASGAGRRQVAARPEPDHVVRRPQPLRRRADGDRLQAGHPLVRAGQGLCDQAALDPALSRHLRRRHGEGLACAPTSTSPCASRAARSAPAARSRT